MIISKGRGALNSRQAWSALKNKRGQWWQMDAGAIVPIVGAYTQRRRNNKQRVTSYKVQVSSDARGWSYVDGGRVFRANLANNEAQVPFRFSP